MWGQGLVVDPDEEDSQSSVEGPQAVVADPGDVATASGTENSFENRLESKMQYVLGGMTDAFSVNLPFTVEDKKRIAKNLTTISEEYQDEELHFTRAVLLYMLKELHDVFGNQDAFKSEIEKLVEKKAAIEKRAEEANAGEEGLAGRKRKRLEPATATGSQVSTK